MRGSRLIIPREPNLISSSEKCCPRHHGPFSKTTTSSPARARTIAAIPPPAPLPMITVFGMSEQVLSEIEVQRHPAVARRYGLELFAQIPFRMVRAAEAGELPADAVLVSTVNRVAVDRFHDVGDEEVEEVGPRIRRRSEGRGERGFASACGVDAADPFHGVEAVVTLEQHGLQQGSGEVHEA